MGEKKLKDKQRDEILREQPNCIFCGGLAKATTTDHVPPKNIFVNKQWPMTYEFSACSPCNNGSKVYDDLAGFLSLLKPTDKDKSAIEYDQKRFRSIRKNHSNIIDKMFDIPTNRKRRFMQKAGFNLPYGHTFKDVPIVDIPPEISKSVEVLAAKISKALHFKHTGKIVPIEASIRFRWYTNANLMMGENFVTPEILALTNQISEIKRNNSSLRDQFDYRFQIAPEGNIGIYLCEFGNSFGFVSIVTFNPEILENIASELNQTNPRKDVMKRIYWPFPEDLNT